MDSTQDQDPSIGTSHLVMLPPNLWNLQYITHSSEILSAAITRDPELVSRLFASSAPCQIPPAINCNPTSPAPQPTLRIASPQISPYDGKPENLRPFCSQLVNQMEGCKEQFATDMAKVRFAYQCLGPGALLKMRSSFRCLEDPTIPPEITTLQEFLDALRQRCQDPGLEEKATRALESLYQKKIPFHEFITLFEDLMANSTFASQPKSQWKIMLKGKLSKLLQDALVRPMMYRPIIIILLVTFDKKMQRFRKLVHLI